MMKFSESKLYQRLKYAKHGVFIWVGTGQWGKTVGVNSFAQEEIFWDRNVVLINYPDGFVSENYPPRYRSEHWPDDIMEVPKILRPSKDFVIIDDAAWLVGARDHATRENRDIQKILTIASHFEIFISVTIQNTSILDLSLFQAQDVYVMHKHMDAASIQYEREGHKVTQYIANETIADYQKEFPQIHPKAWTYCSTTNEVFAFSMPTWWKPMMSKPYYGVIPS